MLTDYSTQRVFVKDFIRRTELFECRSEPVYNPGNLIGVCREQAVLRRLSKLTDPGVHRFFWAAHHSAAQHAGKMYSTSTLICRTRITPPSPFKKGAAVSALSCSRNYDLCSIAMRVFRSELPGAGERQNLKRLPHSVEN